MNRFSALILSVGALVTLSTSTIVNAQEYVWCDDGCRKPAAIKANKAVTRLDGIVAKVEDPYAFYEESSEYLKSRISLEAWQHAFKAREAVGVAARRQLAGIEGMIVRDDIRYVIVNFDVIYEGSDDIFKESVTLEATDSDFKLAGYHFVRR